MSQRSVVVLGGGVAGIAAAVGHHELGFRITLVEARRHLGGRAFSLAARRLGQKIDNGPHVLLGCYRAFRRVLRALGAEQSFHRPDALQLTWLSKGGRVERMTGKRLPAPLHLVAGFLGIRGLELTQRFELLLAGLAPFLPLPRGGVTVATWLRHAGFDGTARTYLFDPLCRAVMNAEPDQCDAGLFVGTLREAFAGNRAHSAMWIPVEPWDAILDKPARDWLGRHGHRVLLGHRATTLEARRPAPSMRLDDGTLLADHDRLVVALDWRSAHSLTKRFAVAPAADRIPNSPLVTVHVALPPTAVPFDDPIVALLGGQPFHFLCRRPRLDGAVRADVPASLLAGGATDLDGMPAARIVSLALGQLANHLGRTAPWPEETHASALVVREPRATIAPRPSIDDLRPTPGPTHIEGLWLAGDWTATGLPSTLEGAARSSLDPLGQVTNDV